LAWRFKDLPDRLIGAYGQLESKWPVCGSVLILNDRLYFAAGRSSYLDGGIFVYALNPRTGELWKSRSCFGPFEENGFPAAKRDGFKNDILVTDGTKLYVRHKAFDLELADADGAKHIIPNSNFLDGQPQHRTCWTLASSVSIGTSGGDIMVSDGKRYYDVQGFPIYMNHSYFDPRKNGYTLFAGTLDSSEGSPSDAAKGKRGTAKTAGRKRSAGGELWRLNIPITGKAIALAGDVLFVAGEPMKFDDPTYKNYVAAYNGELGGRLLAVSATDGKQLAEFQLNAAPAWDGIAIANQCLYIALEDGTVQCLAR
jgi:outer membrane protein assembly factor BamB